jgi:hypothetical protein
MAAVSTREVFMASMSSRYVRTGSRSDHDMSRRDVSRREGGGHSVSTTDDVSTTASTDVSATSMSTTTMSTSAATMAAALGGSIGGE